MKNFFILFGCFLICLVSNAQQNDADVLLTIDGNPIYKEDFINLYSKNLSLVKDDSQKNVDDYLQLFIDYKLKVLEAEAQGLDTISSFIKEYNTYKNQLADKFLNNNVVTQKLLEEAYERKKQEIKASHILIEVGPKASPNDTLKAYNKALEARNKIINGEDFEKIAKVYSSDPSVRGNGGALGWFGVFKMVYPFESAAYQTKAGEVSMPVRTQFGYHIIKVNEKRKAEGSISIAHLLISDKSDAVEAKKQIDEVYKKINAGADFSAMAKQYSDDENTAVKGGKLHTFSKGALNSPQFENQAFLLTTPGEISKPFQTKYGWHIVKLLERFPIKSFEEEMPVLESKIKRDSRSKLISDELQKELEKQYQPKTSQPGINFFIENIPESITEGKWNKETLSNIPQKEMLSIQEASKSYYDFVDYIYLKQKKPYRSKPVKKLLLEDLYKDFKELFLLTYHKNHLAEINNEYAQVLEEYKNGLLLFDLMQKNVWNVAQKDTLAVEAYYKAHQQDYIQQKSYKAQVITINSKKAAKKIADKLKHGTKIEILKEKYPSLIVKSGEYHQDSRMLPSKIKEKLGISEVYMNNGEYIILNIEKIIPAQRREFGEVKGIVASDFQNEYEDKWMKKLRQKHQINIHKETLNKIKQELEE